MTEDQADILMKKYLAEKFPRIRLGVSMQISKMSEIKCRSRQMC
jgi:hypothetical protein